jgi:hypothetical protein
MIFTFSSQSDDINEEACHERTLLILLFVTSTYFLSNKLKIIYVRAKGASVKGIFGTTEVVFVQTNDVEVHIDGTIRR